MGFEPSGLPKLDTVSSTSPAVEVTGLTIRYGNLTAVDNLDFRAFPGRVTAVLGPNGAGKTSTIECCEGLRKPASGSVRVLDLDPQKDQRQRVGRMGVMLQEGGVYPSARVRETIELYAALYGNVADPDQLMNICGLSERPKSTWRQLSGGERQRLSLALALTARPEVAFLDEPTSGVDITGRGLIRETLRAMAENGCAVVVATHELDEAERIADDIVVINRGRTVLAGTLNEIRSGRPAIRFGSDDTIDLAALSSALGTSVERQSTGEFRIDTDGNAELIGKLGSWLATNGHPLRDVNTSGESLAEIFTRVVGDDNQ